MKNAAVVSVALVFMSLGYATEAVAAGAIEIGGRTAVTANFGVATQKPDDIEGIDIEISIVNLGLDVTRTTDDGRYEFGAGFTVTALIAEVDGEDFSTTLFTPSAQVRMNSDLLGAEENFLVFAGFIAGVTVITYDIEGIDDDEVGAFGPKFGGEYYFSNRIAAQLEDSLLFDTDKGITNTLTLGVKVLF